MAFVAMLVGLLVFHHRKNQVVGIGFAALTLCFLVKHGGWGYVHHLTEHHRAHLLLNLAGLLPGFALVAHYFEHSGAAEKISRVLRTDASILWTVFWLSTFLDNIAAAMIGGVILLSVYGKHTPFRLIVSVIAASNLGGAGSPVGDTTTVMLFLAGKPVGLILRAFMATIPAQYLICLWASRHDVRPLDTAHGESVIHWRRFFPLLGIPGLVIGNIYDQPAIGLWVGLALGQIVGRMRFDGRPLGPALRNTIFLVTLVATAELLPLESAKPMLARLTREELAVLLGFLSAWFDNIPLTAIALSLGGFMWGLLAYCVGYGGTAMWFGSSAGVAMGLTFPQTYDTKKWLGWTGPFVAVTVTYLVGVGTFALGYRFMTPHLEKFMSGQPLLIQVALSAIAVLIGVYITVVHPNLRRRKPAQVPLS